MRTLLLFGDSNTHGTLPLPHIGHMGRFGRNDRWPGRLQRLLPDWEVIAEGLPGRTTLHDDPVDGAHKNGLAMLPGVLETHWPVDAVLLMLGTNDLKGRFGLSATDIALSLEKLVLCIKASGAGPTGAPQILLVAPPPIIETGWLGEIFTGGAAKSRGLAAQIKVVADRLGVPFLDAGALVQVSAIDGIHYDAPANAVLAEAFAAAVRQHFG